MQRVRSKLAPAPRCPDCSGVLQPDPRRPDGSRYVCADCRGAFRVERVEPAATTSENDSTGRDATAAVGFAPAGTANLKKG